MDSDDEIIEHIALDLKRKSDDDDDEDRMDSPSLANFFSYWRNLVSQEARYQEKLSELSSQLAARECEANRLRQEIEDLKRELVAKASGMDRLQAELEASNKEGEYVKQTLRRLEGDVTGYRHKSTELAEELQQKNGEIEALKEEKTKLEEERRTSSSGEEDEEDGEEDGERVEELERRVRELEASVADTAVERDRVLEEKRRLEKEREEEMKIVQEALDEAIEEKASIQARFERDFERLRTVNTDREQQLLDDFEWKLREVQATSKRKLEERDRAAEERLKAAKEEAEASVAVLKQELAAMKIHEAELAQLRGLSHEQQRSIRMGARQIESLQVSEKILQEEASSLRQLLEKEKTNLSNMHVLHDKKVADLEKSWKNRLEALRNEVNRSWEVRMKKDKTELRGELEAIHLVEKKKLEEEMETKMKAEQRALERKLKASLDEITQLKTTMENKETNWRKELEKTQANADRDIFDLRRKLDKIDMSYQDQIEILTTKHQQEIEKVNEEAEQRLAAAEQNWQMQLGSTRTTLELVKEQMERDAQKRVENLLNEYETKLECQWKRLNEEKETAVLIVERKFIQQLELLKEEMEKSSKISTAHESEQLYEIIDSLKNELQCKTKAIDDLQENVDVLHGGMQVLNEELNSQSKEMDKFQSEAEKNLREKESQMEAQLLRQLEMLRNAHKQEKLKWQTEAQALRDALKRDAALLSSKWGDSGEAKRPEGDRSLADLMQVLEEQERDIAALTEENRFYRLELARQQPEAALPAGGPGVDARLARDRSPRAPPREKRRSPPHPATERLPSADGSHGPSEDPRPGAAGRSAAGDASSNRLRSRSVDLVVSFNSVERIHCSPATPSTTTPCTTSLFSSSRRLCHSSPSLASPSTALPSDAGPENISSSFAGPRPLDPVPRDPTPPL